MNPRLSILLAGLLATTVVAQDTRLRIEFPGFFSRRNDPMVAISDPLRAQAILDSLAVRLERDGVACSLPAMQALSYNGVRLRIDDAVWGKKSIEVRAGCVSPGSTDHRRNLEKMAVAAAFFEDDLNAPGGPRAFAYLACGVPDSLRPASAPCATASTRGRARSSLNSMPTAVGPAAPSVGADGRQIESRRSGLSATYPATTP